MIFFGHLAIRTESGDGRNYATRVVGFRVGALFCVFRVGRKSVRAYLRKRRKSRVSLGQSRIGVTPGDRELGVVPKHPAFILWVVKIIAPVDEFGHFRTNYKTMGEAARNEQLPLVVSRQHYTDPAAKGS